MSERLHLRKNPRSNSNSDSMHSIARGKQTQHSGLRVVNQWRQSPTLIQTQADSNSHQTLQEAEHQEFQQNKLEATKLEIQAKYGTLTPEDTERLSVLQAKMNGLLQARLEHTRYGYNFANISPRRQDVPSQQVLQTKLAVGQPGDKYEQEAESTAHEVMGMPDVNEEELQMKPLAAAIAPLVQRQCATCEEESSGNIESQLNSSKGGGSPLPNEVRAFMEPRFGHDFSKVRVHSDRTAVQMNRELGAQAFTHGSDIYYGDGKFPGNNELTAHELTHVVQQNSFTLAQPQQLGIQRSVTFDECETKEFEVKGAHEKAIEMCENTIAKLRGYNGTQPANVKAALAKHFHSTTHKWYFQIAETVAYNLAYVIQEAKDTQYECHDQENNGSTLAWSMWCVPFTDILLYKKWFASDLRKQANTLVHEWMHRYGCKFDLGYDWEPEYINSGTLRAIHNAEPYGNIVQELG